MGHSASSALSSPQAEFENQRPCQSVYDLQELLDTIEVFAAMTLLEEQSWLDSPFEILRMF